MQCKIQAGQNFGESIVSEYFGEENTDNFYVQHLGYSCYIREPGILILVNDICFAKFMHHSIPHQNLHCSAQLMTGYQSTLSFSAEFFTSLPYGQLTIARCLYLHVATISNHSITYTLTSLLASTPKLHKPYACTLVAIQLQQSARSV